MTESPPTNPDAGSADDAAESVKAQLDRLLAQIETEEPGTIEPAHLPEGFKPPQAPQAKTPDIKAPAAEAPQVEPPAAPSPDEALAEAEASFEAALDLNNDLSSDLSSELPDSEADAPADASAGSALETPDDPGEADMLAALNAALQDLNPQTQAPAEAETPSPEPSAEAAPTAQAFTAGDEAALQDEISALLSAPPQEAAPAEPETSDPPAPPPAQAAASSLEDQIADEIQGLLDAEPTASTLEVEPSEPIEADAEAASIDELDRMLAEELDDDAELAGDFQSVEELTAGIDTGQAEPDPMADEHAASARDVAAELDSQPESAALDLDAQQDAGQDPLSMIASIADTAQRNADIAEAEAKADPAGAEDRATPAWRARLSRLPDLTLGICFAINWPARRFLTRENRANLGYIALLNLFIGTSMCLYVVIRLLT